MRDSFFISLAYRVGRTQQVGRLQLFTDKGARAPGERKPRMGLQKAVGSVKSPRFFDQERLTLQIC